MDIDVNKVIEKLLLRNQQLTMQVAMLEVQVEQLQEEAEKPKGKKEQEK